MRYQSRKSSCGPAALANALEAIGIVRTEDELSALSGQGADGTSQQGLEKALKAIGIIHERIYEQRKEVAGWALSSSLRSGNSVVIVVDNMEHWAAVIGMLGDRFIVADSADNDLLLFYSLDEMLDRWESDTGRFYGVIVKQPKES